MFVNLFIPSVLTWNYKGITVRQETAYPESSVMNFAITTKKPVKFAIKIRRPLWSRDGYVIKINGKELATLDNGFIIINRTWADKDKIELSMPMSLYTERMPDNPNRVAFLYGPVVLAGQLGNTMPDPVYGVPVLLTDNKNIKDWIKPVANETLSFEVKGVGKPFDVKLIPFYKTYKNYYSVYWDYFTNDQWTARQEEYENREKTTKRNRREND